MTTGNHEGEVGMSSQRVSGTAVQRTIAVLGSAVFFVVAPCTLAGLVPWSITGWQLRPPFLGLELTRGIGAIMILAGVPGLVDAFARFALQGLGTPAPIAPTRNLVVTGLYRYVRNPIYVAVVAIILGQAVLMGDWRLIVYGALLVARLPRRSSWRTKNPRSSGRLGESTRRSAPPSRAGYRG